jgi:hypothetical protein
MRRDFTDSQAVDSFSGQQSHLMIAAGVPQNPIFRRHISVEVCHWRSQPGRLRDDGSYLTFNRCIAQIIHFRAYTAAGKQ